MLILILIDFYVDFIHFWGAFLKFGLSDFSYIYYSCVNAKI